MPIDGSLFALMYLLFTPCIIKDLWSASDNAKYYINLIGAYVGLFGLIIASAMGIADEIQIIQDQGQKRAAMRKFAFGVIGVLILTILLHKRMVEFGFQIVLEFGCLIYGLLAIGMNFEKHPKAKQMLLIAFCLAVTIVDWKLTVDAVRSGHFWHSLLYNFMHHIFVTIWWQFVVVIGNYLSKGWAAVHFNEVAVKMWVFSLISVLYITCAAPYTTRKIYL